jgi:hypothetical protein
MTEDRWFTVHSSQFTAKQERQETGGRRQKIKGSRVQGANNQ